MISTGFRQASKRTLGEALWPFAGRLTSRLLIRRRRGLILTFHYLGEPILRGVAEDLFLSRSEFAATLDFVCASLCPLDPETFLTRLEKGTLPPGATLLTFDDCAAKTVTEALPELVSRNLKACFFANPGLVDAGRTVPGLELMDLCRAAPKGSYELRLPESASVRITDTASRAAAYRLLWPKVLACPSRQHVAMFESIRKAFGVLGSSPDARLASWDGLEELHDAGMLVGNHTMFHSTVDADGLDQFTADVDHAYGALEARFGSSQRVFCYPYGRTVDATPATTASLRTLRTAYGFVTQGGIACSGKTGLLHLRREEAAYSAGAVKLAPLLATLR
jgi:peptidoglycan/xylan/chitin deacetylase (PgdA/CDA1 family)